MRLATLSWLAISLLSCSSDPDETRDDVVEDADGFDDPAFDAVRVPDVAREPDARHDPDLQDSAPMTSEWLTLETELGGIDALFRHPAPSELRGAVIYNHGAIVESLGYEATAAEGYDVDDFVAAIADAGYAALAPMRGSAYQLGDGVVGAAVDYLRSRDDVDGDRIFLIGFSKGGLVTFYHAAPLDNLAGVVLMSPAIGTGSWSSESDMDSYLNGLGIDLEAIDARVMFTLGDADPSSIRTNVRDYLVPRLASLDVDVDLPDDYPGDHRSFWVVRDEHWPDVVAFLNR
jgi:dienelactone hydrolase